VDDGVGVLERLGQTSPVMTSTPTDREIGTTSCPAGKGYAPPQTSSLSPWRAWTARHATRSCRPASTSAKDSAPAASRDRAEGAVSRSLHAAGLIDRYTLLICPLTLGTGARLFEGPAPLTEFELTSNVTTTKGVIIAQYTRR
jgi:hypothetical protein